MRDQNVIRASLRLSPDLHKRIRVDCAIRGVRMHHVIVAMLEREYPDRSSSNTKPARAARRAEGVAT